jgi:hypothetical protein
LLFSNPNVVAKTGMLISNIASMSPNGGGGAAAQAVPQIWK